MVSDTSLIKVFIPKIKAIIDVRRRELRKYDGTELTGVDGLLDDIARQV